jgi:hypothetical protein
VGFRWLRQIGWRYSAATDRGGKKAGSWFNIALTRALGDIVPGVSRFNEICKACAHDSLLRDSSYIGWGRSWTCLWRLPRRGYAQHILASTLVIYLGYYYLGNLFLFVQFL